MECMQSFTCKVNGCPNQSQYPERIKRMPHVNNLQWHKAPENADVRRLWGLLIKEIARHSFVCSNHFVNGQPSVKNPHPTLYLDGNSTHTSSRANEIIQRWRKDREDEQLKTDRLPAIKNRLTKSVESQNSSPAKNAKVTKSAEPLNSTCWHSNKAEFVESLETQNSFTYAKKTRLTNNTQSLISSLPTKSMIFAKGEEPQNSLSHTQKGKRIESAESPNSSTPAKKARLTKSAVSQNSSSPAKRARLSNSADPQKSFSLGAEVSFKEHRSESASSKSDGIVVSSGGSDSKNSDVGSTKVDNSEGIQMCRDGNAPSGLEAKTKSVTTKLKIYNDLAKLRLMLKKPVQNDKAVIDDQEVNFSDIPCCVELNENTLKHDLYPRLQLTRLPLPKDIDFSSGCVNLSSLPASVYNYTGLIEEETPALKPFHPDNNKIETADIFQKEFAKEVVLVSSQKLECVKPHAAKTKDLSSESSGGDEDFASLSTEKQSTSATKNELMSGVPVHNNIYEPPCPPREADGQTRCANCKFHLHHINLITGQMDSFKKQIKMIIDSNKDHINTNCRLNQKLLDANAHVGKLEAENQRLKNTIWQIKNNVNHGFPSQQLNQAGGHMNLVQTKDGRTFLLNNPVHGGNAKSHPTQPSPAVSSSALSQMNSITSSQSCVPRNVVPQSHVRQPPPSVLQLPNQSQALTKPAQMFLRLGPGSCLVGQINKDVPCSTGVVSQPDHSVSPAVSVESKDTGVVPQSLSTIPNGTGVLSHPQDSKTQPVSDKNTSVSTPKYVSAISQLQASMNKFTNSQSSANMTSQQPVCNMANQPPSLMPIQPHLAPKATQLAPIAPCLAPTLPRMALLPPRLAPIPPRLSPIPPRLAPIPLRVASIPQRVAPIPQHVGNTGSQCARPTLIISPPAQTHAGSTLPTSQRVQTPVSHQPNHNSNLKCVICKFLARQVHSQKTEIANLEKQLDVLDKINAQIVGMFIPASSAFLCLIGMEQIKC